MRMWSGVARFKTEETKISKPCQRSGRLDRVRAERTLYSRPRLVEAVEGVFV